MIYFILQKTKRIFYGYVRNEKIHIFYQHFLNMDISLIPSYRCLKFAMRILKTHSEGSVSQIFYLGLSFCFIVCRS